MITTSTHHSDDLHPPLVCCRSTSHLPNRAPLCIALSNSLFGPLNRDIRGDALLVNLKHGMDPPMFQLEGDNLAASSANSLSPNSSVWFMYDTISLNPGDYFHPPTSMILGLFWR